MGPKRTITRKTRIVKTKEVVAPPVLPEEEKGPTPAVDDEKDAEEEFKQLVNHGETGGVVRSEFINCRGDKRACLTYPAPPHTPIKWAVMLTRTPNSHGTPFPVLQIVAMFTHKDDADAYAMSYRPPSAGLVSVIHTWAFVCLQDGDVASKDAAGLTEIAIQENLDRCAAEEEQVLKSCGQTLPVIEAGEESPEPYTFRKQWVTGSLALVTVIPPASADTRQQVHYAVLDCENEKNATNQVWLRSVTDNAKMYRICPIPIGANVNAYKIMKGQQEEEATAAVVVPEPENLTEKDVITRTEAEAALTALFPEGTDSLW